MERFLKTSNGDDWKFALSSAAALLLFCILYSFPPLISFFDILSLSSDAYGEKYRIWSSLVWKSEHLFENINLPDHSHDSKLNLRLTVPFIFAALKPSPLGFLCLRLAVGFGLLYFLAVFFRREIESKTVAFALLVICASQYFSWCVLGQFTLHNDIFPFFFATAGYCLSRSWAKFFCYSLSVWCDERALITVFLFAVLSWLFEKAQWKNNVLSALLAVTGYVLLRAILTFQLGLSTPIGLGSGVSLLVLSESSFHLIGLFSFFKGGWLLIFGALIGMICSNVLNDSCEKKQQKRLAAILLLLLIIVYSTACFAVRDVTRSGSYMFPILLFLGVEFVTRAKEVFQWTILRAAVAISVLCGPVFLIVIPVKGYGIYPVRLMGYPLPYVVYQDYLAMPR